MTLNVLLLLKTIIIHSVIGWTNIVVKQYSRERSKGLAMWHTLITHSLHISNSYYEFNKKLLTNNKKSKLTYLQVFLQIFSREGVQYFTVDHSIVERGRDVRKTTFDCPRVRYPVVIDFSQLVWVRTAVCTNSSSSSNNNNDTIDKQTLYLFQKSLYHYLKTNIPFFFHGL